MARARVTRMGFNRSRYGYSGGAGSAAPSRLTAALIPGYKTYQRAAYAAGLFDQPDPLDQPIPVVGGPKVTPAAPAAQPPAPTPASPAPKPPARNPGIDYESDPILQKARALARGHRDDARAAATSQRKQLVIDYGLDDLAGELGLDAAVAQSARENPFSVVARIRDQSQRQVRDTDEALNRSNLFFSGYRGRTLDELARARLEAEAGAQSEARRGLGGIESQLLAALMGADQLDLDAEAAAYARALEQARLNPPDGDGGGGDGEQPITVADLLEQPSDSPWPAGGVTLSPDVAAAAGIDPLLTPETLFPSDPGIEDALLASLGRRRRLLTF